MGDVTITPSILTANVFFFCLFISTCVMAMCAFKCDWYTMSTSGCTWHRENDSQRQYKCPWSNIQIVPILPPQPRFEVLIEVVWFTDSCARLLFSLRLSGSWWMQRRLCGRTGVIPSRPTAIFSHHPETTRSFSLSLSLALLFLNEQILDSIWL